ncbi:hypothetical protein F5Y10DRAFT_272423 [Nemania abortiva]|nr:hypothetical protein F5Y10DRAFT_272423 [Nemania abortiva]
MPSKEEIPVWYCCHCGHGPWNFDLDDVCHNCRSSQCDDCRVEPQISVGRASFVRDKRLSTHPRRNTIEVHSEFPSAPDQGFGRRGGLINEDLEPFKPLLTDFPTSSAGCSSDQPWNPLFPNRVSEVPHQRTAAQSMTSHSQEVFTAYLDQPWGLSPKSSTYQGDDPENLTDGKAVAAGSGENTTKGEQLQRERHWGVKPLVDVEKDQASPSSFTPLGILGAGLTPLGIRGAGRNTSQPWKVAETVRSQHNIFDNSPPPCQEALVEAEKSSEINTRELRPHAFDPLAMAGSWVEHDESNSELQIDIQGSEAMNGQREKERENEHTTDHNNNNDLDDLNALLNHLNLQDEAAYLSIILRVCNGFRECASCDGGEGEAERPSATSGGHSSQRSSRSSNKRSRQASEDSDSEKNELKKRKNTGPRTTDVEPSLFLACPFYKLNPYIHSSCTQFKGTDISKVGSHLRSYHIGDDSCKGCYKFFRDTQERAAHITRHSCRPIKYISKKDFQIRKTKGVSGKERWYSIWSQLFKDKMQQPEDPWWSEEPTVEQISLSAAKKLQERTSPPVNFVDWMKELVSKWRTSPPEHLPVLLQQMSTNTYNAGIRSAEPNSTENPRPPGASVHQASDIAPATESSEISSMPMHHAPYIGTDHPNSNSQTNLASRQREATPSSNSDDEIKSPTPDVTNFEFSGDDTHEMFLIRENNFVLDSSDQNFFVTENQTTNWEGIAHVANTNYGIFEPNAPQPEAGILDPTDPSYFIAQWPEPEMGNWSLGGDFPAD